MKIEISSREFNRLSSRLYDPKKYPSFREFQAVLEQPFHVIGRPEVPARNNVAHVRSVHFANGNTTLCNSNAWAPETTDLPSQVTCKTCRRSL